MNEETTEDPRPQVWMGSFPEQDPEQDPDVGHRIGPYRVEKLIARGGMGRVYLALREDDYEQRVALKVVDRGPERLDILDRFVRERQILARLEHPNIARIFDGGTTADALPFFVMEYVEGERVDLYCERRPLLRRLELFQQICHVVQFAHRNLVVHRDLKPSNILITAAGTPKLLDFGIATLLHTEAGAAEPWMPKKERLAPMTPSYASPEQLLDDPITAASDVYSLGVLLYQLVTGRHPYPVTGREHLVRLICYKDPPPPSTVVSLPAGTAADLDAIVLKAMRKIPEQRYASAAQLAEDVRRHLAHLPVDAHPGTWGQRALKAVRRHRLGFAVLTLVLVFAVTVTILWRDATQKERIATQARAEAEAALQRKEKMADFLRDLLKTADPDSGGHVLRGLLDLGHEKLAHELTDEPEVRAELLGTLGIVYNNLALYHEARKLKEEALDVLLEADPSDRAELAAAYNNLGRTYLDLGDVDEGQRHVEKALAMWRLLGDERKVVLGMRNLGAALARSGRDADALTYYGKALAEARRLFGGEDPEVGKCLYFLAVLHRDQRRPAQAEPLLRTALAIYQKGESPTGSNIAAVLSNLGRVLHDLKRHDEAREYLEQVLETRRLLYGEEHVKVANARKNLAALLLDQRETAAAGEHLEKALAVLRKARPDGDWTVAEAETLWGVYLAVLGRPAEAEPFMLDGYRTIRAARGDGDVATAAARQRVLALYELSGQDRKATAFAAESSAAPAEF